jgi:RNA polymerase sigma-70 factor (ECF subfamily)
MGDRQPSDGALSVTSATLIRDARDREPAAWEELVRTYSRRMYRWCRVAGLQPADAANVVQESLAAVSRALPNFRRDRAGDTFRGWLRRIVDNKVRDHFRRQAKQTDVAAGGTNALGFLLDATQASEASAAEPTPASPERQAVMAIVDQVRGDVGDRNWRFFWRVAVDGQSAADVGREFDVTANTVRIVKMRVLRRLRAGLADAGLEDAGLPSATP